MFEVLRVLYREMHYQMLKRNPVINDEKIVKRLRKFSIKRNLAASSFFYTLFGCFIAGIALTNNKAVIASLAVTLSMISFIFTLYITAVNSHYIFSLGIFEPLKTLPVKVGAYYLSGLLLLDTVTCAAIAIPAVIVLAIRYPLQAALVLLWVLTGILIGHTIGLLVFSFFGLRISYRKTKGQFLKSVAKIIGLVIFMSAFYSFGYLQSYLTRYSEKFAEIFGKYAIAYPFSAASVFDPVESLALLAVYSAVFIPLYRYTVNRVWRDLLEPRIVFERGDSRGFTAGSGGTILALVIKDLKLVFRKTSMAVGFLIPLYVILPQVFFAIKSGHFSEELVISLIAIISFFSTLDVDTILRAEGKEIDFLRTLPVTKAQFVLSKSLSASVVSVISSTAIVCLGIYFDRTNVLFLPHAFLLPVEVSLLTMLFLFNYEGEEIGIPEKSLIKSIALFIINGILLGIILVPAFLIPFPEGVAVSYVTALIALLLMLRKVKYV